MVGVAILMYLISNSKSSYKPSRNDHRGLQSLNNVTAPNPGAVYSVIVEDDAVYAPQIGFGNEVIRQNKNNDKLHDAIKVIETKKYGRSKILFGTLK